jgi:hypothetical protein
VNARRGFLEWPYCYIDPYCPGDSDCPADGSRVGHFELTPCMALLPVNSQRGWPSYQPRLYPTRSWRPPASSYHPFCWTDVYGLIPPFMGNITPDPEASQYLKSAHLATDHLPLTHHSSFFPKVSYVPITPAFIFVNEDVART